MFKRHYKILIIGSVVALLSLLTLVLMPGTAPRQLRLRNTVFPAPVAQALLAALQQELPGMVLTIDRLSTLAPLQDTQQPALDIILTDLHSMAVYGAVAEIPVVRDGVALIVNANNPIRELTAGDVEQIYLRKLHDWKFVGGEDAAIDVLRRGSGYAEVATTLRYFKIRALRTIDPWHSGHSSVAIAKVAQEPEALGFVSLAMAHRARAEGLTVKLLTVQGVTASPENVLNGSYQLQHTLGIGLTDQCRDLLPQVQAAAASAAVRQAIVSAGFDLSLPQSPGE